MFCTFLAWHAFCFCLFFQKKMCTSQWDGRRQWFCDTVLALTIIWRYIVQPYLLNISLLSTLKHDWIFDVAFSDCVHIVLTSCCIINLVVVIVAWRKVSYAHTLVNLFFWIVWRKETDTEMSFSVLFCLQTSIYVNPDSKKRKDPPLGLVSCTCVLYWVHHCKRSDPVNYAFTFYLSTLVTSAALPLVNDTF